MTINAKKSISTYYSQWNDFTYYQGNFSDPYYSTGDTFDRYQHKTQYRWLWVRVSDKAIVYEQYFDGSANSIKSYVKYFVGGIVENLWLFTSDFRISKCTNPFVALPKVPELTSSFSLFGDSIAVQAPAEAVSLAGSK